VKTRLIPPLSPEEAASLNTCFLRDTAAAILSGTQGRKAQGVGVYTPIGSEADYRGILPDEFVLVPQRGEGFGERLRAATDDLLQLGFDALCLIDSDSPTVPADAFAQTINFLTRAGDRVVLGPSDDGGYYLIGLKRPHHRLFEQIDWSTERVFDQTVAAAQDVGVQVNLLSTWYDVDDRATLARLCRELFGSNGTASRGYPAPVTRGFLQNLLEREGRDRIWPNESKS